MNDLSADLVGIEARIEAADLSFVREKILADGKMTPEQLSVVEIEFQKYMKLVVSEDGPLAMIDKRVDEFWHTFILFTPQYRAYCESVVGFFVDHQPRTSLTPVPTGAITKFVEAYCRRFGDLPSFWLETADPDIVTAVKSGFVPESLASEWSGWTGRPTEMRR